MKNRFLPFLFLGGVLLAQPAYSATSVLEDFSNDAINRSKFTDPGGSVSLDTVNGNLILTSEGSSYTTEFIRNRIRRQKTDAAEILAQFSISEYSLGNTDTQHAFVSVAGMYYNSKYASPTNDDGEVFVRLAFGDQGNGLEVWYWISVGGADLNYTVVTHGTLNVDGLALNKRYDASISYDGDHSFEFIFEDVDSGIIASSGVITGPTKLGPSIYEQRRLDTGLDFGQVNSTPNDPNDTQNDDGSKASITAIVYDFIEDSSVIVDTFDSSTIDPTIWKEGEFTRVVENGKLKMIAKSLDSDTARTGLTIPQATDFLGAKLTLLSTSTTGSGEQNRARIAGYWYNDTFDESTVGNGIEGDIWTEVSIRRKTDGTVVCLWGASRNDDATGSTWTELFYGEDTCALDTEYKLSIERSGSNLILKKDGVTVKNHTITTSIYPPKDPYKKIRAETRYAAGETHILVDDVTTDHTAPTVSLTAKNDNNEQVSVPAQSAVKEGDIITLTANVTDPANIAAFIWEQTSGPDVSITTAPRAGTAAKLVGSNQSISFTIPSGSDTQTLSFKVTVVDTGGAEANQVFDLSVDNSATATLNTSTPTPATSGTSSGGGGSIPFEMIIFLLATLMLFGRKPRKFKRH